MVVYSDCSQTYDAKTYIVIVGSNSIVMLSNYMVNLNTQYWHEHYSALQHNCCSLSSGGFGVVCKVLSSGGRPFALKRTLACNEVDLANLKREIKIVVSRSSSYL